MSGGTDPFGQPFEKPPPGLDPIGWFIATSHSLLGHDVTQRIVGGPVYDKADCLICKFEREPTPENKLAVYRALKR